MLVFQMIHIFSAAPPEERALIPACAQPMRHAALREQRARSPAEAGEQSRALRAHFQLDQSLIRA